MKDLDENVKSAISKQIAAGILAGISTEHRDAILQKTMESALTDYDFRQAVQKEVVKEAARVAELLLTSEAFQGHLRTAIETTMKELMQILPNAMRGAIIESLCGKDGRGQYDRRGPGILLEHIEAARKGGDDD